MKFKCIQNAIDSSTGKSNSRREKQHIDDCLKRDARFLRWGALRNIDNEFNTLMREYSGSHVKEQIAILENLKSGTQKATRLIIRSLSNHVSEIKSILQSPTCPVEAFSLLNFEPLHLLVALHVHLGVDNARSIIKLLQIDNIDYMCKSYGVAPADELFKMGDRVRDAFRVRILKDIARAIKDGNYDKALQLVELDPDYLATARVPGSNGKTIIFYAAASENKYLIQTLVHVYRCDPNVLDDNNQNCFAYAKDIITNPNRRPSMHPKAMATNNYLHTRVAELRRFLKEESEKDEYDLSAADKETITHYSFLSTYQDVHLRLDGGIISPELAAFIAEIIFNKANILSRVILHRVQFIGNAASILIDSLHYMPILTWLDIGDCNLDDAAALEILEVARTIPNLKHLSLSGNNFTPAVETLVREYALEIRPIAETSAVTTVQQAPLVIPAELKTGKAISAYLDKISEQNRKQWLVDRANAVTRIFSDEYNEASIREAPTYNLKMSLNADSVRVLENLVASQDAQYDTPQRIISKLKADIELRIAAHLNVSFQHYIAEVEQDSVDNWRGTISDLHIIARILQLKIFLSIEGPDGEAQIKTYGDTEAHGELQLIKRGNQYFAVNKKLQVIIPNAADDLNMFRACVHSEMLSHTINKPHLIHFLSTNDESEFNAIELREMLAKCHKFSIDLCEPEFKAYATAFLDARTIEELILATHNLPQTNLEVMETLIDHKTQLDAIKYLEQTLSNTDAFDLLNERTSAGAREQVMALITSLHRMQESTLESIDLRVHDHNQIDISNLEVTELGSLFEERANEISAQVDEALEPCNTELQEFLRIQDELKQQREAAIEDINRQIDEGLGQALMQSNSAYNQTRSRQKKALRKNGILVAASLAITYFFRIPVQSFFVKVVGMPATGAYAAYTAIATQATILTVSKQLVFGGRVNRIPETFAKTFTISAVGQFATASISGGHSMHNLPTNSLNAAGVLTMQRTFESLTQAIINNDNILKEGLTAAIAHGVVYTAAGDLIFSDSKLNRFMLSAGAKGVAIKLRGGDGFEIMQGALLQGLEDCILAFAESILPPRVAHSNKVPASLDEFQLFESEFSGADNGLFASGEPWGESMLTSSEAVNPGSSSTAPAPVVPMWQASDSVVPVRKSAVSLNAAHTSELKVAPQSTSKTTSFGEDVMDFVISPAGAADDPRSMTDIIPAGTDDNTVSMSDMLARYEPDPGFVYSLGVGLFRGERDQVGDSVREFLGREEYRYTRRHEDDFIVSDVLKYGVGRMAGGVRSALRIIEIPAQANNIDRGASFIHSGIMSEYDLPSDFRANVPNNTKSDKNFIVRAWDAYCQNYDSAMEESRSYMKAGSPFMAGFTSGVAQTDVAIDAASIASLGYGLTRLAPSVIKTSRAFFATLESRSPFAVASMEERVLTQFDGFVHIGDSSGTLLTVGAPVEVFEAGAGVPRSGVLFGYERFKTYASNKYATKQPHLDFPAKKQSGALTFSQEGQNLSSVAEPLKIVDVRASYPKTSMADLLKSGQEIDPRGVTLTDKKVDFTDLWKLTVKHEGIEVAMTTEIIAGETVYRVYGGDLQRVVIPRRSTVLAHTHPEGAAQRFPSYEDINQLNMQWANLLEADTSALPPRSRVVWGPTEANITEFSATGVNIHPKEIVKRKTLFKLGLDKDFNPL